MATGRRDVWWYRFDGSSDRWEAQGWLPAHISWEKVTALAWISRHVLQIVEEDQPRCFRFQRGFLVRPLPPPVLRVSSFGPDTYLGLFDGSVLHLHKGKLQQVWQFPQWRFWGQFEATEQQLIVSSHNNLN